MALGGVGTKIDRADTVRYQRVSNTQTRAVADTTPPNIIQIPGEFFPHSRFESALWIRMAAKELTGINTGRRGGSLRIGRKGPIFKFLAPESIVDAHNHEWKEYASIQSRILQKVITGKTGIDQWRQVYGNLKTIFKDAKNLPSGQQVVEALQRVGNINVPKYKIDTPLAYSSSNRRVYTFNFNLADSQGGQRVREAVTLLQKYAAPEAKTEIDIEFPYVFNVTTEPEGLINMDYAVINSILTTWQHPYIKGRPTRCECTITFLDMSPLFRKTVESGGIVNVYVPKEPGYDAKRITKPDETINKQSEENIKKGLGEVISPDIPSY